MRIPLIAANWKMNTSLADAHLLANGMRSESEHMDQIVIVLCPPSIWLTELAHGGIAPREHAHLKLGAQNMYPEEKGAFTGEISPLMVKEVAEYVIVGHSERTHTFGESAELISKKIGAALQHGITPIVCIGEEQPEQDFPHQVIDGMKQLLEGLPTDSLQKMVVAYEPVWAVGSGNPATPDYAQAVIAKLRTILTPETRILYGGSVTPENAQSFLEQPDIDGFLVGGASLNLKSFSTICQLADDVARQKKN